MIPPKPLLTWDEITDLEFLSHIETLRGRDDIQTKDWTKKPFRNAVRAWIKLQRAHEELDIIATEARRLTASIENEEAELAAAIDQIKPTNLRLALYLAMSFRHRMAAHMHLRTKLVKLKNHSPYNGVFGSRASSDAPSPCPSPSPSNLATPHQIQSVRGGATGAMEYSEDELQEDAQEESNRAIDRLVDVFANVDVI